MIARTPSLKLIAIACSVAVLTACGGGSGDDEGGAGTWTVDGVHTYQRLSSSQDSPGNTGPYTGIYSTGDCSETTASDYRRCSTLALSVSGNLGAGVHPVVRLTQQLNGARGVSIALSHENRSTRPDHYFQFYEATSGSVRVTIRPDGNYVFDIQGSVPMQQIPSGRNPDKPIASAPRNVTLRGEGLW